MRAWRLVPEPEIRTVILVGDEGDCAMIRERRDGRVDDVSNP
jgi:hypothetical protein